MPADSFGSNAGTGAMETDIDIPEEISYITDIKTADGLLTRLRIGA